MHVVKIRAPVDHESWFQNTPLQSNSPLPLSHPTFQTPTKGQNKEQTPSEFFFLKVQLILLAEEALRLIFANQALLRIYHNYTGAG